MQIDEMMKEDVEEDKKTLQEKSNARHREMIGLRI